MKDDSEIELSKVIESSAAPNNECGLMDYEFTSDFSETGKARTEIKMTSDR